MLWSLGGVPILIVVLGTGIVAFGAAVSWIAFRTKGALSLAAGSLAVGALAWWSGLQVKHPLAAVPFEIAAGVTIGAGLVIMLGELARSRRTPGDDK
jgi:hypothetical protein